ncbi:MAG: hypothetical protein AAF439_07330 [Pseudomonadota bacterium]
MPNIARTFLAAALIFLVAAPSAFAASTHAKAKKLGDVDISLFCPAGSAWYPVDGGACLTCGGNKKPKAGFCPGIYPAKKAKARFSHMRTGFFCKGRPFKRPKTKECWVCPRGYVRVPGVKFNKVGICWKAPKPYNNKPTVALKISLKDMLNPARLGQQAQNLGCKGYNRNAVFSPADGGTCWVCPKSHPKRTAYPIKSAKACGTSACGGEGQRSCNTLAGEGWPCNKGLSRDMATGLCKPKVNFLCKPTIATIRGLQAAAEKTGEAGKNAMEKVPGLNALLGLMDKVNDGIDAKLADMMSNVPTDKFLGSLDTSFGPPERIAAINAVIKGMGENQDQLLNLILDKEVMCGKQQDRLRQAFVDIANQAMRDRAAAPGGSMFADLGLISVAHAGTDRIEDEELFGIGLRFALMVPMKLPKIPKPIVLGVQGIFLINEAGQVSVTTRLAGGMSSRNLPAGKFIAAVVLGGVVWGQSGGFPLRGWIESNKGRYSLGLGAKFRGSFNVRLKPWKPAAAVLDPENAKGMMSGRSPAGLGFRTKIWDFWSIGG